MSKTVIEMAREAGLHRQQHNLMSNPVQHRFSYDGYEENLERFAELVRADAIAQEREACAKVCEEKPAFRTALDGPSIRETVGKHLAAAIRARGQA